MSVKTIEEEYIGKDTGVAKKINAGATRLVFDILQSTQYSTPIPSTVRELVVNAFDSQREKEIAIEILTGQKKVEDYYITREGEQYADSNFNPDYYDLSRLDTVNNTVEVVYEHNPGVGYCDRFRIKDYGVGIGARRLEGVLELGYSTKRNTSENFGAFGLGAKVALSTGVDYYVLESVYNGKRVKAHCFNYKTDFVIPRFRADGTENPKMTLSDGTTIYYEEVDGCNWTEISFGVKKHNSVRFKESVVEQLNYLQNVRFWERLESGAMQEVYFKTSVLYDSETMIVSKSTGLARPHIVIVKGKNSSSGINYGYVDFKELEMEELFGPVGFKCPIRQTYVNDDGEVVVVQDGVDVTPSREKVIWSESTKAFVQDMLRRAAAEVSELVSTELSQTDFLKWLEAAMAVANGRSKTSDKSEAILVTLSRVIDTKSLRLQYSGSKGIYFTNTLNLFQYFDVKIHRLVPASFNAYDVIEELEGDVSEHESIAEDGESGLKGFKLISKTYSTKSDPPLTAEHIFHREKIVSKLRSHYILNEYLKKTTGSTSDYYITIRRKATGSFLTDILPENRKTYEEGIVKQQDLIESLLSKSSHYKFLDDIEVPEEYKDVFKTAAAAEEHKQAMKNMSPAEIREMFEEIVCYTVRPEHLRTRHYDMKDLEDSFVWDKIELPFKSLLECKSTVYYGTNEDELLLKKVAAIIQPSAPSVADIYKDSSSKFSLRTSSDNNPKLFFYEYPPSRLRLGVDSEGFLTWQDGGSPTDVGTQLSKTPIKASQVLKVNTALAAKLSKLNLPHLRPVDEFFLAENEKGELTCAPEMKQFLTAYYIQKIFPEHTEIERFTQVFDVPYLNENYPVAYKIIKRFVAEIFEYDTYFRIQILLRTPEFMSTFEKYIKFQLFCAMPEDQQEGYGGKEQVSEELFVLSDIPGADFISLDIVQVSEFCEEFSQSAKYLLGRVENGESAALYGDYTSTEYQKQVETYLKAVGALAVELPLTAIENLKKQHPDL